MDVPSHDRSKAQRMVMWGMCAALWVSISVVWAACAGSLPDYGAYAPASCTAADTLAHAASWDLIIALCLIASVGHQARHRFFTPADFDGSALTMGTDAARLNQAIIQNTLEQAVCAVVVHFAWAARMPCAYQTAIPAAVTCFVVGRICFAAGYSRGAPARAFGFALTFYPTVVMLLTMIVHVSRTGHNAAHSG